MSITPEEVRLIIRQYVNSRITGPQEADRMYCNSLAELIMIHRLGLRIGLNLNPLQAIEVIIMARREQIQETRNEQREL